MNAPQPTETVAVLTLSETGEILAARDACLAVFSRDVGALIGVNIRVLLKGGLDNEVGRSLHAHRTGKNPEENVPLNVVALKKDGTEFMACATTRKWNSDATMAKKSEAARLTWTIEFRDLGMTDGKMAEIPWVQPSQDEASEVRSISDLKQAVSVSSPTSEEITGPSQKRDGNGEEAAISQQKAISESDQHEEDFESQPCKAEAGGKADDHQRVESELRAQLDSAKESVKQAEAALQEEAERRERLEERLQTLSSSLKLEQAERSKRFEQELISLRQERDELNRKLDAEQQAGSESTGRSSDLEKRLAKNAADFERAKAELEERNAERDRVESAWREQLDTAFFAKKQIEGAWAGEVERSKRLEEELSQLRQEHDELATKLVSEQEVASKSRQRAKEVESRLGRNAAESERARIELEKETAERERLEAEWRGQLAEANARKEKSDLALSEATRTNRRLEQELARIQAERDHLNQGLHAEQKAAAESARRVDALQRAVNQSSTELERIHGAHEKLEMAHAGALERSLQLESDLEDLQQKHDGLAAKLATHQTTTDKSKGRVHELKDLLEQRTTELEKAQAELNGKIGHRDRVESDWKKQLDQAKAQAKELEAAWTTAVDRNMHFEEMLSSLRAERDDLARKLKTERQAVAQAKQELDELQSQRREGGTEALHLEAELEKRDIEQARTETELNRRLEKATALTKKLETAWTEAVRRNQRLEAELEALRCQHDEPAAAQRTGPAAEKPPAPQIKPRQTPSGREIPRPAPERVLRVERNSIEPNGKNPPIPKAASMEKTNGHRTREDKIPINGGLSNPPKPSVGLYNLKP